MTRHPLAPLLSTLVLLAQPVLASQGPATQLWQAPTTSPARALAATDQDRPPAPDSPPPVAQADAGATGGGFTRFFIDVGRDYKAWFTLDTTRTLMVGTATAMFVRPADEALTDRGFPEVSDALVLGDEYGNLVVQVPIAVAWWAVGHAVGPRHASAGRDLLRAQISAASWTYGIKHVVNRTRPNGDPRSFPSGHTSATFATATVLQRHYGWKMGVPFYLLGVYTAGARIHDKKHWLSDTVMGATVGIAAGRAVTFHLDRRPVHVVPAKVPGGLMLQFVVDP